MALSRGSPHDSGSPWFATPSTCGSLIHSFPAGSSRRTDVPTPQFVRLRREQFGTRMVGVAELIASLADLLIRRENAVHRALRAEVAALVEHRRVDLRRREVHEARLVKRIE